MEYPAIGKAYTATEDQRAQLQTVINSLEWFDPDERKSIPMSPGLAIKAAIKEFRIPKVSAMAYNGVLGNYSLLGIEGNYANGRVRLYLLDRGNDAIFIAADPQAASPATVGV